MDNVRQGKILPSRGVVGVHGGGRRPLNSLYEMIGNIRFRYACDLVRVWRPPTSYGVHTLHF